VKAMRKATTVILLAALVGCVYTRTLMDKDVSLVPGVGINGIANIGMSVNEVMEVAHGYRVEQYPDGNECLFLDMGISVQFSDSGRVNLICVRLPTDSRNFFMKPFSGSLFFKEEVWDVASLSREKIIDLFGDLERVSSDNFRLWMNNVDHAWMLPIKGVEILYYFSEGIQFNLKNGVLESIAVFHKNGSP
jgi:hypothetical protein